MGVSNSKKVLDTETKAKLEAAVKELFSQQDFHQVNMRAIAKKTGIGLNTIYAHYESKEKLLFSFIDEWVSALDSRLAEHLQGIEDIKERFRKTLWVILDFYNKNPDVGQIVLFTVPFKTWMTDETFKQKEIMNRTLVLLREGQEKGLLDANIPVEIMFNIFYGAIHRIVYIWLYLKKQEPLTSYVNMYCDIIWRAIESPNNKKQP